MIRVLMFDLKKKIRFQDTRDYNKCKFMRQLKYEVKKWLYHTTKLWMETLRNL